jgi:hypothetical protein
MIELNEPLSEELILQAYKILTDSIDGPSGDKSATYSGIYNLEQDPESPYFPDAIEKYFARPHVEGPASCTYFQYYAKYLISASKQKSRIVWGDDNRYYIYPRSKVRTLIPLFHSLSYLP